MFRVRWEVADEVEDCECAIEGGSACVSVIPSRSNSEVHNAVLTFQP